MLKRTTLLVSVAAAGLLARPAQVHAQAEAQVQEDTQTTPPTAAPADPPRTVAAADPGEILVTARRRQESILRVPVVENVVSAGQIQRAQLDDIGAIATRVPGLNLGAAVLAIGPQISLRGVGTSSLDAGVDQSVSLNIDGLSLTQGLAFTAGIFDLAQAEVLKGPQALFFGKNSPAGVISLRSADPGDTLELIGRFGFEAEAGEKRTELIVSTPVTDTLGVRLAGLASFQNGFFRNRAQNLDAVALGFGALPPAVKFAPSRNFIVRGTAVWRPSAKFKARLKANYAYDFTDGDASEGELGSCPDGTRNPSFIPFINPAENCRIDRTVYFVNLNPAYFPKVRHGGVPFFELSQKFGTLELNYTPMPTVDITSITGYYHASSNSLINSTLTGFAAPPYGADNTFRRRDVTQEFRADTSFAGPLNATVGGFFQVGHVFNRIALPLNTSELPAAAFPSGYLAIGSHDLSIRSYSAFGQLRYKIVPRVELAGGVRWTRETRSDRVISLASGAPVDISLANDGRFTTTNYSPEATVTWTPTDTLTVFGAFKKGYKSGSFTITTPFATSPFGDESVKGFETGAKTRLLDRQLSLNLALYSYEYSGLQVGINVVTNGQNVIKTQNAAGARVKGIDFDFTFTPHAIAGLSLNGAINYNHARFTNFPDAPCLGGQTIAQGCDGNFNAVTGLYTSQNLSGTPLVRAPDWQINAGADYDLPLGANKLRMGVAAQYSSKYLTGLGLRSDLYQTKYVTFDANLSYLIDHDRIEFGLVGRNLSNQITTGSCTNSNLAASNIFAQQITGGTTSGPAGVDELGCVARRGRELWVRVSVRR